MLNSYCFYFYFVWTMLGQKWWSHILLSVFTDIFHGHRHASFMVSGAAFWSVFFYMMFIFWDYSTLLVHPNLVIRPESLNCTEIISPSMFSVKSKVLTVATFYTNFVDRLYVNSEKRLDAWSGAYICVITDLVISPCMVFFFLFLYCNCIMFFIITKGWITHSWKMNELN